MIPENMEKLFSIFRRQREPEPELVSRERRRFAGEFVDVPRPALRFNNRGAIPGPFQTRSGSGCQRWTGLRSWTAVLLAGSCLGAPPPGSAANDVAQPLENGLSGATILIIRHAEKPVNGSGLSSEGQARAEAYVDYFRSLRLDSQRVHLDYLVAAEDSEHSMRSRLTLEPLARSIGLKADVRFQSRRPQELVRELKARSHGKVILVCWHHKEIPDLLRELGADPNRLLPEGEWPAQQFGWMLRLRYDQSGRLIRSQTKRIKEHLMPDD